MIELLNIKGNKKVSIEKGVFLKKHYDEIIIEKISLDEKPTSNKMEVEHIIRESLDLKYGDYILSLEIIENSQENSLKKIDKNNGKNDCFITNLKKGEIYVSEMWKSSGC